ncbi:MAG: DUF6463 family protein [Actinomycetaceae bacterium]|nr:DUF6463 family protein [Actinomycetaceae bacterium]
MESKTPWVGWSLIAIGILHNAVGVVMGWPILLEGLAAGGINVWEETPWRSFIYWFLICGFALMLMGGAVVPNERRGEVASWGWISGLGLLAIGGVVTMPISGFWTLLIPLGISVVRRVRAERE